MRCSELKPADAGRRVKISKMGLALALVYVLTSAICIAIALGNPGDPKGRFVFLQIPIAWQLGLVAELGWGVRLRSLGWFGAYVAFGIPTLIGLYAVGWAVGRGWSAFWRE